MTKDHHKETFYMEDVDAQYIRRVQAGDVAAFGYVYDSYIDPIYRFAFFKTHHKQVAEDITSDIFLRAIDRIHTYDARRGTFRTWLYQLARHMIIDHYRSAREATPLEDALGVVATHEDASRQVDGELLMQQLEKSMAGFSAVERDVVVLRVWQHFPYSDIAVIVGKRESNCKKIYSRAVKKLQEQFPRTVLGILLLSIIYTV